MLYLTSTTHKYHCELYSGDRMNLVRSSHSESVFTGVPVLLEVTHLGHTDVDLLHSLVEIWLNQNCQSDWKIDQYEEGGFDHKPHTFIKLLFEDPKEAIYFKLSSQYLHNKPVIPLYLCYANSF